MTKIVMTAMVVLFILGSTIFACRFAHAEMTHVSINQQLFTLGGYPKFRMNIVSDSSNYSKIQFIVQQGGNEERLMVKPINEYLLQLTGVEDVDDPSAVLIIKEYRINKWQNVKSFPLFTNTVGLASVKVDKHTLKNKIKVAVGSDSLKPNSKAGVGLVDDDCSLDLISGQTLWKIGRDYSKEWQMSTQGSVVAIYEANPKAFYAKRISSLRADSQLRCPSNLIKEKYRNKQVAQRTYINQLGLDNAGERINKNIKL